MTDLLHNPLVSSADMLSHKLVNGGSGIRTSVQSEDCSHDVLLLTQTSDIWWTSC